MNTRVKDILARLCKAHLPSPFLFAQFKLTQLHVAVAGHCVEGSAVLKCEFEHVEHRIPAC